MKKWVTALLAVVLAFTVLAGCKTDTAVPAEEPPLSEIIVRVASLKGPTTMGLVKLLNDGENGNTAYQVDSGIYGTADEVMGLLLNGTVDIAAIPANLASVLYNKTNGELQVAAINTLGVLYIVENGNTIHSMEDLRGKIIYSTGKGTTPEFVLNSLLKWNDIDPEKDIVVEYKSESTEIAALLAESDQNIIAVLPQPYVTSVVTQYENTRVALDLTNEWQTASGNELVTGVVVVNRSFAEKYPSAVQSFLRDYKASTAWVNANAEEAAQLIEHYGIVAKAALAQKALPFCNITFIEGDDMKQYVSNYLTVLFEQNPASIGGKLPDEEFYYKQANAEA